jgi:chaperonin cofactor prefoldin
MPPLDDYLSDTESARICGVSVNTLNRFISTGYLKVEHDHDGLRLFSKNQLKRVFGVNEAAFNKTQPLKTTIIGNVALQAEPVAATTPLSQVENQEEPKIPHLKVVSVTEPVISESNNLNSSATNASHQSVGAEAPPLPLITKSISEQAVVSELNRQIDSLSLRINNLEGELNLKDAEKGKFENVIALLEKMLDIRESEIDSLKRQQKWLEERVEKMEERSQREQLLLLAESETVRKLVIFQKRSPVRAALEWLGLAEPTDTRNTIEANR